MINLVYIALISFCLMLTGCNKEAFTIDGLHIYPMDTKNASAFSFKIKGGERHINKIDWGEESLPTSAKSCHHGGEISSPQRCIVKALYDNQYVYFYFEWDDKTKDINTPLWVGDVLKQGKDDGISVIFSNSGSFNCTETCHMSDWKVEEGKFISDYRMFNDKDKNNLILLRYAKTRNKPLLAVMDKEGKKSPEDGELFVVNSKKGYKKPLSFQLYQNIGNEGDSPYFPDKPELFILNDKNVTLDGKMEFGFNRWKANIKLPLSSFGLKNPKKGDKIYFAVAVFDGTQINHSISDTFTAVFE